MTKMHPSAVGSFWLRTRIVPVLVILALLFGATATLMTIAPAKASTSVGGNDYPWPNADMNSFSPLKFNYRNCTDYAAYEINEQMGGNTTNNIKFSWSSINYKGDGNAEAWKNGATGKWPVDTNPVVGSVAWWAATNNNKYGHVAIVASVSNKGNSIVVDEYNLLGTGLYGTRSLKKGVTDWPNKFIHVADITSGRPVAISFNGALNVFKIGGDGDVYQNYWNGTSWNGWSSLGGNMASNPTVIVNGTTLDIFERGQDGQIYTEYNSSSGWSGWASLGGHQMKGNPTVMFYGTSMNVFALDTNNVPYEDTWTTKNGWLGWTSLGNYMASDPGAVSFGGKLYLVFRGGDNVPYVDVFNGTSWSGFSSLGGSVSGNPSVLNYAAESELDVYFNTSVSQIWKTTYNGSSWGSWTNMGSGYVGDPYITTYGNDLEVYARGTDNQIYTRYWSYSSQSWSGWASLGGRLASGPYALQYGSSELDVFATGTDGKTYKDTFTPTNGWGGFSALN